MSNTFNLFKTILSIVTTNPIFLTKIYFTSIKFLMKKYTMLYKVFFFISYLKNIHMKLFYNTTITKIK